MAKTKKMNPKNNENNRMPQGNRRSYSRKNNSIKKNKNKMMMNNINNYQINKNKNIVKYNNTNKRNNSKPKSQKNKLINYDFLIDNNRIHNNIYENNYELMDNHDLYLSKNKSRDSPVNMNNNNRNTNKNMAQNNNNNVNRKNSFNRSNTKNTKLSSFYSSSNDANTNYISPLIDNFSHIAIKENYSNIDNLIKMNQFREMNNDNYNNLRENLSNNSNSNKNNINNSKIINHNKIANQYRKGANQNNLIEQMKNTLKKNQMRKINNIMTQSNAGNIYKEISFSGISNKGYYSDGYLNK